MGCFGSKDKLSKEDMDFLKSHTRYDENTIKEWYKGFKVSFFFFFFSLALSSDIALPRFSDFTSCGRMYEYSGVLGYHPRIGVPVRVASLYYLLYS